MRKTIGRMISICLIVIQFLCAVIPVFAHSGRTDSSGGHRDNKNKSGLGSYHYHCGGYPAHLHSGGYCPYRDIMPSSVQLSSSKYSLGLGETASISASVSPSNACNTSVSLSCNDNDVVAIQHGTIKAVGYGSATINASSFNGKTAQIVITVKEIKPDSIRIEKESTNEEQTEIGQSLYIGDQIRLRASVLPVNVDDPTISWNSSDNNIASVDENGHVFALQAGDVTISAIASNGIFDSCSFTIEERVVDSLEIKEPDTIQIELSEEKTLRTDILPDNATNKTVSWMSENPNVVSVSDRGVLTGNMVGSTVVTATSSNGLMDYIIVEVTEVFATSLSLEGATVMNPGDSCQLNALFMPDNTTDKSVVWSISNEDVAEVNQDGTLHALNVGTATVSAVGKTLSAELVVEVQPIPVSRIDIVSSTEDTMDIGETVRLLATVSPENATDQSITWSTSDPAVASINDKGFLEAKKAGTTTITASSSDGCVATMEMKVLLSDGVVIAAVGVPVAACAAALTAIKRRNKKR